MYGTSSVMKVYSQHGHIHLSDISRHSRQVDTVRLVLKAGRVMSMGGDGYSCGSAKIN